MHTQMFTLHIARVAILLLRFLFRYCCYLRSSSVLCIFYQQHFITDVKLEKKKCITEEENKQRTDRRS